MNYPLDSDSLFRTPQEKEDYRETQQHSSRWGLPCVVLNELRDVGFSGGARGGGTRGTASCRASIPHGHAGVTERLVPARGLTAGGAEGRGGDGAEGRRGGGAEGRRGGPPEVRHGHGVREETGAEGEAGRAC